MLVSTHDLGSVPEFCDRVVIINRTVLAAGPTATTFTEANLARVRSAAGTARDRLSEIEGVRVIGPEVSGGTRDVRLAMDLRDTGRDAWDIACAMAGRGFKLDAASNRVIVIRLSEADAQKLPAAQNTQK